MARQRRRAANEDPDTDNDPILALYRNYFAAARRLHEMVEEARRASASSFGDEREMHLNRLDTFLPLWLSALFTACEGFRKIEARDMTLDARMQEIMDPLRRVWQHTVEYHGDLEQKQGRATFYGRKSGNLNKAEALHAAFEEFFRNHLRSLEQGRPDDADIH
ncbi:MAG: hypothetical protein EOO77_08160 [Oxalobacteraceae bacterium]|nr:MAG: hypothetical protein EOO77_08160 [Oxalobacteraceae bacterium]